ncbi:tetratricopeptide repeat protein [Nitrosospira sp. Nsp1]|uniref:tetratricopeptide repeat protein n=1 Tax=Nitrosospira sp. Nsp1 TaxID=136547 RepID=UPI00088D66D4|nr:tetratricopeptide repeat protein [Nitrosospira sp. Nsp1]SCX40688.1 Flp pilus assembly protein TadD, contains TPR repeats [Nitrosospira sp. Nsp1]
MKKISRNDPCPCNSGRKYKHCCQKHESGASSAPSAQSISEYLQAGIQYHQSGDLHQAQAIYQRILQVAPDHPGALHFLGLIARQMGKTEIAIELIGKALVFKPDYAEAHGNLGNALRQQGRVDDAIASYRTALRLKPNMVEVYVNLGNALKNQGKLDEAIASYRKALTFNRDFAEIHTNLGNALREQDKPNEAIASYRRALMLKPDSAEAHSNLGNMLIERGNLEDALASFQKALILRPDFAEAHSNLGNALRELGRLDEAVASYRNALARKPDYAEAYSNLANALNEQGKLDEAVFNYQCALQISENPEIKSGFAQCIRNVYFTHEIPGIRAFVARALSEARSRPADLGNPAVSLIKLNPGIRQCIDRANSAWPNPLSPQELFETQGSNGSSRHLGPDSPDNADGLSGFANVCSDVLLQSVLETTPVCDMELERFLTMARYAMLHAAIHEHDHSRITVDSPAVFSDAFPNAPEGKALVFYCALARQCFINEYIFACSGEELELAQRLKERLAAPLAASLRVSPLWLAAVAAYFPLISVAPPEALVQPLLDRSVPDAVAALLAQQVREPLEERRLRSLIPQLTPIVGDTSRLVQKQYEENPYPRWIKLPSCRETISLNRYLHNRFPFSQFIPMSRLDEADAGIDILIAGCGTGQHSIATAQRHGNANVLAVDLSLTSLCYARRKTEELGLGNIEYAQADITSLSTLGSPEMGGRMFDLIESVGVLHHLANPLAGWRELLALLRPGGFMRLGFYSEFARQNEADARLYIAEKGYAPNAEDIRRCRQDMMSPENALRFQKVLSARDFYTMSECRDLLFHVQEHHYTLPLLKENLRELDLAFLGFSLEPDISKRYRECFPEDISQTDLDKWHTFEIENPDTFKGMYQFWLQKPVNTRH